jgi:2-polyprenyl-6-methoxyphenol hydroxylase-like FAD-dependent oxidoreductase
MSHAYDAIVVGARCAGSPTAMLLARRGHRVLLVDRTTFPADTVSTHLIHPPGVASLERWALLDRVVATGSPPIDTYAFDFGPFTISGGPGTEETPAAYAPRRTALDKLLVDAASAAGAEVRERFTVESLVVENDRVVGIRGHEKGGKTVTERATVVIGADGRYSLVADAVGAQEYNVKPRLQASYYTYWSGLPMSGRFETALRPGLGYAAWPTNDDLTLVIAGRSIDEFEAMKSDIEGSFLETLELVAPAFSDRVRGAKREERFVGTSVRGYLRKPFGAGWALVGDAGYNKDFITAQGIHDAFRDAELCATALDEAFADGRSFESALSDYQARRDEQVLPMYEFTAELAALSPPPPELQQLLSAVSRSQEAMDAFARVSAGVTSPAEFFSDENAARILAAAA